MNPEGGEPSTPPEAPRPPVMSLSAAMGWSFGATFALLILSVPALAMVRGPSLELPTAALCQTVAYLGAVIAILHVYPRGPAPEHFEASVRSRLGLVRGRLATYPIALILGIASVLPMDAVYGAIVRRFPVPGDDAITSAFHDPKSSWIHQALVVAVATLVGPALEELFFRGAIYGALTQRYPRRVVIVATALFFALAHLRWQRVLPIGALGLLLGLLRHAGGSVFASALMHMAYNGVSCLLAAVPHPYGDREAPPPSWVLCSAAVVAALVGITFRVAHGSGPFKRAPEDRAG